VGETQPTAVLTLKKGGKEIEKAGKGDGLVDAVFNAIDRATGFKGKLENYTVKGITPGHDAQGEATVSLSIDGDEVHGRGVDTDVLQASAKAYLNGVNKLFLKHKKKSAKAAFAAMKGI